MNSGRSSGVLTFLETRRQEMIDFACELIAAPSMNPPGDERAVVGAILARMRALGMEGAQVLSRAPERPNIVYSQRGRAGAPVLIFNGHTDTKAVGLQDRKLWQTDPLKPTFVNGQLHGLGATDMKGGIAAIVYAAAALHSLPNSPEGDLQLILVANEEAAGEFGANWLVKNHNIRADFCVVGEPCGIQEEFDRLPLCARTSALFKVKVYGTQMHSSISDAFPSVNASVKMAWVLWRMAKDLKLHYQPHEYYPNGPTINLGDFVSGGVHYGIYPGFAEFGSDIRLIPGMSRKRVEQDLLDFLARLRREDPELEVELEMEGEGDEPEPRHLRGDEPFIELLQRAAERILGRRLPTPGFPAFTDAYWFHAYAGIPSIPAFGPGLLPLAHRPNEHVSPEGIVKGSKMLALAALAYLDSPSREAI